MAISSTLPTWKEAWWNPGRGDASRASVWWSVLQRRKAMIVPERSDSLSPRARV